MSMTVPIEGPTVAWRGTNNLTRTASRAMAETDALAIRDVPDEKMVGPNNLRDIAFLEMGVRLSNAVAFLTIPKQSAVATGFMIGPSLLLTNWHVYNSAADATDSVVRFNYQRDLLGNMQPTTDYKCTPGAGFHSNKDLDYAVVSVEGSPGAQWGCVNISFDVEIAVPSDVFIIQHPAGMPKQIAASDNEVEYADERVIQYLTDTMPGSSGSPVFDDYWRLIALHHSGGWIPQPNSSSTHFRNEGIRASAILNDLPGWAKTEIERS